MNMLPTFYVFQSMNKSSSLHSNKPYDDYSQGVNFNVEHNVGSCVVQLVCTTKKVHLNQLNSTQLQFP